MFVRVVNTPLLWYLYLEAAFILKVSVKIKEIVQYFLISSGFKTIIARMKFQPENKSENLSKASERFMIFFFHLNYFFDDAYIVCIGVSTPPQKHPPPPTHPTSSFLPSLPLNLETAQPSFLGNPPLYIGFS